LYLCSLCVTVGLLLSLLVVACSLATLFVLAHLALHSF
jgi:hypothetical protein